MKPIRVTDKKRLKDIRNLTCVVCADPNTCAHHLIGIGDGKMGSKAGDDLTIPLCQLHHAQLHANLKRFELQHGSQSYLLRKTNKWLEIILGDMLDS